MDCSGTCGGSALWQQYYEDSDGDGQGSYFMGYFCSHVDNDGDPTNNNAVSNPAVSDYVVNNDDTDDDCASNVHDECGICDGDGYADSCDNGSCSNMDCAGDCGGNAYMGDYYTTDDDLSLIHI